MTGTTTNANDATSGDFDMREAVALVHRHRLMTDPELSGLPLGLPALYGYRVVTDPLLTEEGPKIEVPRTWRERLFTRPWNPFRKTKWIGTRIPSKQVIKAENQRLLIMHPVLWERLQKAGECNHEA